MKHVYQGFLLYIMFDNASRISFAFMSLLVKHLMSSVCLNTFSPTESFFPYKTCLSMSFPSKSCLTVRLEFPYHSSLPASTKEQPSFYKDAPFLTPSLLRFWTFLAISQPKLVRFSFGKNPLTAGNVLSLMRIREFTL